MARLVGPLLGSTPAETGSPRSGPRAIPDDLLQEASGRLRVVLLMGTVLWVTGPLLERLAMRALVPGSPFWRGYELSDAISLTSSVISLSLYAYVRRSGRAPGFLLHLGLVYLVYTSLAIGILWHLDLGTQPSEMRPMFSWIGIVVLMFAAILPNAPWKTVAVGLVAVSMNPASMLLSRARGAWNFDPPSLVLVMHYPDYILVGIAGVVSHVVTGLGRQVSRAREMGSYHVGELIGKGGMGEVYRATHRMLARAAAIKLIRPEMIARGDSAAAQLAIKRFRREAEVAASLRSPHTVALYDFGVTDDGALYFVMELLDGMDVQDLVRRFGPLPAGRVTYLLRQVCESLEEAHGRGLVHRDIKPGNIHVGRMGVRHDFVKVLDFGLVKSVRPKSAGHPTPAGTSGVGTIETGIGVAPGTPDYMAPEVTLGEPADARSDIYAVGCVAYYMLTGQPVFEATNVFHMVARHLNDEPVPPSRLAPEPIPPGLEALVLACLSKRPAERPQNAVDLARQLGAAGGTPWGEPDAASWWHEHAPELEVPGAHPSAGS